MKNRELIDSITAIIGKIKRNNRFKIVTCWISSLDDCQYRIFKQFIGNIDKDARIRTICESDDCVYPPHLKSVGIKNMDANDPKISKRKLKRKIRDS